MNARLWGLAPLVVALSPPALALAQTSAHGSPQASPAQSASTVQEVIVTSQKREEDVQKVPISVTPVTGASIEKMHIANLQDLNGLVPSLQIVEDGGETSMAQVSIRGIGVLNGPQAYLGTETTTVIDGVVQATNLFGLVNQWDLNRIEVLAGPQGTLFGANSTAGVLNIVTRQPTGDFGAYGILTYGNYNTVGVQAAVNFPIVEGKLAGKIAFDHNSQDGFYKNLYNNGSVGAVNSNSLRGYLRWTPTDDLDVTLKAQYTNIWNTDTYLNTANSLPGQLFYRSGTPSGFEIYDLDRVPDRSEQAALTLTANWKTPIGQLTSITNYQAYRLGQTFDFTGIKCSTDGGYPCFISFPALDGFGEAGWQASQELRDDVHLTPSLEVQFGLYALTWVDGSSDVVNGSSGLTAPVFAAGPDILEGGNGRVHTTDVAAFGQAYWHITDRLTLQAGLRIDWDHAYLYRASYLYYQPAGISIAAGANNLIGATNLGPPAGDGPTAGQDSWTDPAGKIELNYDLSPDAMIYGYYARGVKAGGFNGSVTEAALFHPYNPEFVDSMEFGTKSEWFEKRLLANLAVFYNGWNNMQVETFTFYNGRLNGDLVNAGQATTAGVQATVQVVPSAGLRFGANVGYLYAKYDKFRSISTGPLCPPYPAVGPAGCAVNYAGRDLPYAPNWTGSFDASYTREVGNGNLSFEVQFIYDGPEWGNYTESPAERLTAHRLLNANISWGPTNGNWSIELWGRNLTNQIYTTSALNVPPLFAERTLGDPLTFGLDFKFNLR